MTDRSVVFGSTRAWLAGEPVWPLARVLDEWGQHFRMYRIAWDDPVGVTHESTEDSLATYVMRRDYIRKFGFVIPCAELLDELARVGPVVEVGAGTGYMTRLMRLRGVDAVGTDPRLKRYSFAPGRHDEHQLELQAKTAARRYRDRAVFSSWPCYDHTWFRQLARSLRVGQRLVVVREDSAGTDDAWDFIAERYELERRVEVPAWPMLNDRAETWVRKR